MAHAFSPSPFLGNDPKSIQDLLSNAAKPLDTACGLLVTDPALLLHLLRRLCRTHSSLDRPLGLRQLASLWLDDINYTWYQRLVCVDKSPLSEVQQAEYQRLRSRSAIAAALVGEWSLSAEFQWRVEPEILEVQAAMAALPSMVCLCQSDSGESYKSLRAERKAWAKDLTELVGEPCVRIYTLKESTKNPAVIATEMADIAVRYGLGAELDRQLVQWASRLKRPALLLKEEIQLVVEQLDLSDSIPCFAEPEKLRILAGVVATTDVAEVQSREALVENALKTLKHRLEEPEMGWVEAVDHLMQAMCNLESLDRVQWFALDSHKKTLKCKRRKRSENVSALSAVDFSLAETPFLKMLMRRPQSVYADSQVLQRLENSGNETFVSAVSANFLCASVFCGASPLGVIYADGDGKSLDEQTVKQFKTMAQLLSKLATLFAIRNRQHKRQPAELAANSPRHSNHQSFIANKSVQRHSMQVGR